MPEIGREQIRGRRLAATTPAPPAREYGTNGQMAVGTTNSQLDIAAILTAALTTRMKPPPQPPRDLRPSTALWLLATGIAIALLVMTLISAGDYVFAILYLGVIQVLAGYAWVVGMAFRRNWQRGVVAAIPPLTFGFLALRKYAKYRPLRFVLTGALLIGAALGASYAQPHTRRWSGASETVKVPPPPVDIATQSMLVKLRYYRDQRFYTALSEVLISLARTDPVRSVDATDRSQLSAEIKAIYNAKEMGVRVEALTAYASWAVNDDDARSLCMGALLSESPEERSAALRLLPRWKANPEVARAIATLLGPDAKQTQMAMEALIAIGGSQAEEAVLPVLFREREDQFTRLQAIEILGIVGGPEALAKLRKLSESAFGDVAVKTTAGLKADGIQARLKGDKK